MAAAQTLEAFLRGLDAGDRLLANVAKIVEIRQKHPGRLVALEHILAESVRNQIREFLMRISATPNQPPPTRPGAANTRRQPMRLSALFEEFCHFLRVEKEAAPRTIETYRWCFGDYKSFVMKQIGGTVLVTHFTAETCRAYQYDLAARAL